MELHDDDEPVGRVLSRKEVFALFGGAGLTLFAGAGYAAAFTIGLTPWGNVGRF
ncbi:MAG: hypothetical protein H7Y38_14315 [Armatimonadetes bacterium]|nr:hypothetical protein [Armatimonadota bacterium]